MYSTFHKYFVGVKLVYSYLITGFNNDYSNLFENNV